jgi:hypothetical protein
MANGEYQKGKGRCERKASKLDRDINLTFHTGHSVLYELIYKLYQHQQMHDSTYMNVTINMPLNVAAHLLSSGSLQQCY